MNGKWSINSLMSSFLVSTKKYSYTDFLPFFLGPVKISLSKESEKNIKRSQKYLLHNLKENRSIYGVNTGFGNLSQIIIDSDDIEKVTDKFSSKSCIWDWKTFRFGCGQNCNIFKITYLCKRI